MLFPLLISVVHWKEDFVVGHLQILIFENVKNEHSAIVDTRWIKVNNDNHIEIVYWYDNEWGYSSRIVDIVKYLTGIL